MRIRGDCKGTFCFWLLLRAYPSQSRSLSSFSAVMFPQFSSLPPMEAAIQSIANQLRGLVWSPDQTQARHQQAQGGNLPGVFVSCRRRWTWFDVITPTTTHGHTPNTRFSLLQQPLRWFPPLTQ